MNNDEPFRTFSDFYPFYLSEHANRVSRRLHFFGTSIAAALVVTALVSRVWVLIPIAIIQGYAFAWVGHYFFEHNKPATFGHPGWSWLADQRMVGLMLAGKMSEEVRRLAGDV